MTMGRKGGLSAVHIVVLVALAGVALLCVISYTTIARLRLPFVRAAATTTGTLRPLKDLALTAPEISRALQTAEPLALISSRHSCAVTYSLECFETTFGNDAGESFTLLLARFPSPEAAVNFGIAKKFQQESEQHATGIYIPTTLENFRWLEAAPGAGSVVYYGGANEHSAAMFATWGPASAVISQDEAARAFSRLLDAQLGKFRSGP